MQHGNFVSTLYFIIIPPSALGFDGVGVLARIQHLPLPYLQNNLMLDDVTHNGIFFTVIWVLEYLMSVAFDSQRKRSASVVKRSSENKSEDYMISEI